MYMSQFSKFQSVVQQLLREADDKEGKPTKPTKTRDKTKLPGLDIKDPKIGRAAPTTSDGSDKPIIPTAASSTRTRPRNMDLGPEGMRHMADLMRNLDLTPDQDTEFDLPEPEPPTTNNLPAVLQRGLLRGDEIEPNWALMSSLESYNYSKLREKGEELFGPITLTPFKDIMVIAKSKYGQGPNEHQEFNIVAKRLKQRGQPLEYSERTITTERMPGYMAVTGMYNADGYTFMLCKDPGGEYIYTWPSRDTIVNSQAAAPDETPALAPPPRRLR